MLNKKCLIIDGSSLMYRAYFATQIKRSEEEALQNFRVTLMSLKKTVNRLLRDIDNFYYAVVTFDTSKSTFRKEMFEEYKSNRRSMPVPLLQNIDTVKDLFRNMGIFVLDAPLPYEGDDAIATLATIFNKQNIETYVVSTDRDLLQLVNEQTKVCLLKKGEILINSIDNFKDLNNSLEPFQISYLKALSGDSSDNYKGLDGIGPVTASHWLIKYKDIEGIYKNIDELKEKHKKILIENKEELDKFLKLSTLVKDLDLSCDLSIYKFKGN